MLASINSQGKPNVAKAETTYTGQSYIDTINTEETSYSMQPLNGVYIEQSEFSKQIFLGRYDISTTFLAILWAKATKS